MAENRSPLRRWIIAAIKMLIVGVLLWLVRGKIDDSWHYLRENPRPVGWSWVALSAALYLVALLPEGIFWYWALRALGQEVRPFETLRAYYIGHLGKYVPGKALVIVLRTALIQSHRVNTSVVVASVFLATLTMMAVGACLAVPILAVSYSHNAKLLVAAGAMAVAAGLPTLPPVFSRLAKLLRVGRSSPAIVHKLAGFNYRTLACGWVVMVLGWIAMGASLWAMLRGLDIAADWGRWPQYTATVAMAVVGGFVSMTPAGLATREAVFALLLGPVVGIEEKEAVIVAVALRLAWLVAELAISAILYVARWIIRI